MPAAPEDLRVPDLVFYDGACGLCHAAVRFALNRDPSGTLFRYAPLAGALWRETSPGDAATPRETVVVRAGADRWLTHSSAALHIGVRLGGAWGVLARAGRLVPRPLRDLAYRGVARVRRRLFARPGGPCPVLAPAARARFDLRP